MPLKVRKPYVVAEEGNHAFIWLGLDEAEAEKGILTNQYLIIDKDEGILLDPGGYFVFERVYRNVSEFISPEKVKAAFFTHQDPDVHRLPTPTNGLLPERHRLRVLTMG